MKPVAVLLRDDWADWESGYLLGAVGFFLRGATMIVTPNGAPVRSVGGMRASADVSIDRLVATECAAIAVIGAPGWLEAEEPVTDLLREAEKSGVPIGGICAGTVPLARAGLFGDRRHTSNGVGFLDAQLPKYSGVDRYVDSPVAVRDRNVVSAPGTAPSTFAIELLRLVAPESAPTLDQILSLSAREHARPTA